LLKCSIPRTRASSWRFWKLWAFVNGGRTWFPWFWLHLLRGFC
jgi:hypothetical protein